MDETSLDDFLSEDDSEERATADGDASATDATDTADATNEADTADSDVERADDEPPEDGDAVEPAQTTSRWDADGVVCTECGDSTERGWESQTGLVCAACKEW
ncbi:DUF7573 domain-containing protein [Salinibaculum rarum]|uniref:DUF7573 domain-containing protein n=1 Tax=Salinibaculum rarum TaxID=3058903 RepID=UPI00265DD4EF|nr:hypothetical protein [Salinibaculum sp. KK48]